jgi:osmotically inducible protein OsmC
VTAKVSFGPRDDQQGFGIEVVLPIHVPGLDHAAVVKLAEKAHIVCPYLNATRNNIPVTLQFA